MSEETNQAQESETNRSGSKAAFKNMLCYIPFVAPVLFFIEQEKSPQLSKHIKYGIFLFIWFLVLNFVFNQIIPFLHLGWILVMIYLIASGILWYKAYSGEDFSIEQLDTIEKKVKDNMK